MNLERNRLQVHFLFPSFPASSRSFALSKRSVIHSAYGNKSVELVICVKAVSISKSQVVIQEKSFSLSPDIKLYLYKNASPRLQRSESVSVQCQGNIFNRNQLWERVLCLQLGDKFPFWTFVPVETCYHPQQPKVRNGVELLVYLLLLGPRLFSFLFPEQVAPLGGGKDRQPCSFKFKTSNNLFIIFF